MQKFVKKLPQLLFYALILFLPTQLTKHFWPDFSYVSGLRIDYLSPTIYLTDVLIFLLLVSWLSLRGVLQRRMTKQSSFSKIATPRSVTRTWLAMTRGEIVFLSIVSYLLFLSLFATNPILSFLKLLKILELIFLGFFVSQEMGKSLSSKTTMILLSVSVAYESILAVWQFIIQGSVGGFWWWLGERTFNQSTPFIGQAIINGQLLLRAYGTFSHPNVMGGYLAITLPLIIYKLCLFNKMRLLRRPAQRDFLAMTIMIVALILGLVALFLSFSRVAWIVFMATILILAIIKIRTKILIMLVLVVTLLVLMSGVGNIVWSRLVTLEDVDKKSFLIRQELNDAGIKIISIHPLFGLGLNNFLPVLPNNYQTSGSVRFLQPAHNIYLMIAAETGIIGLSIFLFFIILTFRRLLYHTLIPKYLNTLLLFLIAEVLFIGFFDHYFYTLQQGQLLAALIFGLAWVKKKAL